MVKRLLYLAVGALALTACTSEDVVYDVSESHNLISFENVVNKPSRAAEELTNGNLAKFNVFGFYTMPDVGEETGDIKIANQVFDDEAVTKVENSPMWTYGAYRFWIPGATYYFYAYSCGNLPLNTEHYGTFDLDMETNKYACDRPLIIQNYICRDGHQHDLIFAHNFGIVAKTDKNEKNETVALNFKHLLAKVAANFVNAFPPEYEVEVSNVKIKNICDKGTYTSITPEVPAAAADPEHTLVITEGWSDQERTGDKVENTDTPANFVILSDSEKKIVTHGEGGEYKTDVAFVVPNNYKETEGNTVYIEFDVEVEYVEGEGENQTKHLVFKDTLIGTFQPEWKEGFSYIYNIGLDGNSAGLQVISFTTTVDEDGNTVDEWVEGVTSDITFGKPSDDTTND